jgi:hypothetical protein
VGNLLGAAAQRPIHERCQLQRLSGSGSSGLRLRGSIATECAIDADPNEPYPEDATKESYKRGSPRAIRGGIRNAVECLHNQQSAK